ncbi:MAG: MFS transporter [Anaerolineales bacterium]
MGPPSSNKYLGVSRNVFVLGFVSFFNDVASEMVYPLVPIFLTSVLGAPASVVGLIEGVAEATAGLLKVVSGWLSDRFGRRKPFVLAGYAFSAFSKLLLGLAGTWLTVLAARFFDRLGKGARTSPRDAMIAESSAASNRGRSFGFHRALDTLGAVVGPLLALWALDNLDDNYRLIFFLAFVPALVGVILLLFVVKDQHPKPLSTATFVFKWAALSKPFKQFLLISLIFALGNSSDAFLILRSQDLGLTVTTVVLVYVLFNLSYAVFSIPAGVVSDRIGPRPVLVIGFLLFSFVYLSFGLAEQTIFLFFLFPIYGIFMALTEGVGKAYISSMVPSGQFGTVFGIYQTAVGVCIFAASFLAGLLWTYVDASAPFIFGAGTALIATVLLMTVAKQ